jgi:hypothetical protein
MSAERLSETEVLATAEDIRGSVRLRLRADGFDFEPYTLLAPVLGRLRLPLRCTDVVELLDSRTLVDRIELRLIGVLVGIVTMTLHPVR